MAQDKKHPHSEGSEFVDKLKSSLENFDAEAEIQSVQDSAKEIADVATDFIRKYPVQSVLGAAAIGFLIGAWSKRK